MEETRSGKYKSEQNRTGQDRTALTVLSELQLSFARGGNNPSLTLPGASSRSPFTPSLDRPAPLEPLISLQLYAKSRFGSLWELIIKLREPPGVDLEGQTSRV